jgi:hypothetical protein
MSNFSPPIAHKRHIVPVYTAGVSQPPEMGIAKGRIKFGNTELDVLHFPSFSKNLLSATQLSTEYGYKQIIDPWTAKLTI